MAASSELIGYSSEYRVLEVVLGGAIFIPVFSYRRFTRKPVFHLFRQLAARALHHD